MTGAISNRIILGQLILPARQDSKQHYVLIDMAGITSQILTEIRDEAREARAETRDHFKTVFHRLALLDTSMNDVKQRLTSLERHMARCSPLEAH